MINFILLAISLHLSAQPTPIVNKTTATQTIISVQSTELKGSYWHEEDFKPANVISCEANSIKLSGSYYYPIIYKITVPNNFDGFAILDGDRIADFRIEAVTEFPKPATPHIGFRFKSMGNKISFKSIECKPSTLYLTVKLRMGSVLDGRIPFTLTIQNSNHEARPQQH